MSSIDGVKCIVNTQRSNLPVINVNLTSILSCASLTRILPFLFIVLAIVLTPNEKEKRTNAIRMTFQESPTNLHRH